MIFLRPTHKIMIDADHEYEGVMKDYRNSLKFITTGGYLIFHDISNTNTGVSRCWKEVKKERPTAITYEFCHETITNCGIGIIQIQ